MNKNDIEFTKEWWKRTVSDSDKLTKWLQKLQRTELSGFQDHMDYMAAHQMTLRERKILTNIAEDELVHSKLLVAMFTERGIEVVPEGEQSTYWEDVLGGINNTAEYCAANYFGEALAAYRFEIILTHPDTPEDIRYLIKTVLPDEVFHRETLQRMAGEEALAKIKVIHDEAYFRLTGRRAA
jgi:rubrerythrin